jgi:pilus assembly protein Flp/PilA
MSSGDGTRRRGRAGRRGTVTVSYQEGALMLANIRSIFRHEEGATAVEYGIMVALIAVVIIAGVTLLGTNLQSRFQNTAVTIGPGTN